MKRLLFVIAALVPTLASAQQTPTDFTINGKVGNVNTPAWAYLFYQAGANKVVDSAMVVSGKFTISGSVPAPSFGMLVIDHKGVGIAKLGNTPDLLNLFVDKGSIDVSTDKDSVKNAVVTGSAINDDNKQLTAQLAPINERAKKLNAERQGATPEQQGSPEFQRLMQAKVKVLQEEQMGIFKSFITSHPDSYLSLIVISQVGKQGIDPIQLERLFNGLSPSLKSLEMANVLKKSIDEAKTTGIGALAPDFTQADADGKPVKLSSFRGKYLLIDFWASWCGPCRAENPNVVRAYQKYKTKNFSVLGVSLDRPGDKDAWVNAVKKDGLEWTQVSDLNFWSNAAAKLYFIQSIPANFLLDPNGKIIAKNLRGTDLDDKLAELFGK
jgi:peroxiredoxin